MSRPNKSVSVHGKRLPSPLDMADRDDRGDNDREILLIALMKDDAPHLSIGVGQTSSRQWGEWLALASWTVSELISKAVDATPDQVHASVLQAMLEKLEEGNPDHDLRCCNETGPYLRKLPALGQF